MLEALPAAKLYSRGQSEVVDIFCRNGKWYRVACVTMADAFGNSGYVVKVSSYDFGKDNIYSKSSLNNPSAQAQQMRKEYEQRHYSFNDMKADFERQKSFYINKL